MSPQLNVVKLYRNFTINVKLHETFCSILCPSSDTPRYLVWQYLPNYGHIMANKAHVTLN